MLAQKMTVLYDQKPSNGQKSTIKRIDARDNVRIFSQDFIASSDTGYYEPEKNIFVLEKNVVVNNGTSIASGNKFIYNLLTKKGSFVGKKDETSISGISNNSGDRRVVVVIGSDLKEQKRDAQKFKKEKKENQQNEQDSKR